MTSQQPRFSAGAMEAYRQLSARTPSADYFVCGFLGDSLELDVVHQGKGGLREVKQVLREGFDSSAAVALFRVTAVDDRGNVTSFRTKFIHVIYVGPNLPVIKRAKIASYNSAFKTPFSSITLALQTSNVDDDLSEEAIEKALRASGGAHQPTSFDFENVSQQQPNSSPRNGAAREEASPSPPPPAPSVPRTPGGTRTYQVCWNQYSQAFHARDSASIAREYAEENARLIVTDAAEGSTTVHNGKEGVIHAFEGLFSKFRDEYDVVKVEKIQPDPEQSSEGIVYSYWTTDRGNSFGSETLCIVAGRVVVHTVVVYHRPVQDDLAAGATASGDFGDADTSEDEDEDGDDEGAWHDKASNAATGGGGTVHNDDDGQAYDMTDPTALGGEGENASQEEEEDGVPSTVGGVMDETGTAGGESDSQFAEGPLGMNNSVDGGDSVTSGQGGGVFPPPGGGGVEEIDPPQESS